MKSSQNLINVYRATKEDIPQLLVAMKTLHGNRTTRNMVKKCIKNRNCVWLLATKGKIVLGSLYGYKLIHGRSKPIQYLLYTIDVGKKFRNRGIGKVLVHAFANIARKDQSSNVWVVTNRSNKAAISTYRSCGFSCSASDDAVFSLEIDDP
jgi:ribosomal protein S18 acetylase RimI-like enzyme